MFRTYCYYYCSVVRVLAAASCVLEGGGRDIRRDEEGWHYPGAWQKTFSVRYPSRREQVRRLTPHQELEQTEVQSSCPECPKGMAGTFHWSSEEYREIPHFDGARNLWLLPVATL